jgi:tetratricopeptide (TPR) repeat protein
MRDAERWFQEALAIDNKVERGEALCDLAYDAECMLASGDREQAVLLFELIFSLDDDDDLVHPAIVSARRHLLSLGLIALPPFDVVVQSLRSRFQRLSQREVSIAIAMSLYRSGIDQYPEAKSFILDQLCLADAMSSLSSKEARFKSTVESHRDLPR